MSSTRNNRGLPTSGRPHQKHGGVAKSVNAPDLDSGRPQGLAGPNPAAATILGRYPNRKEDHAANVLYRGSSPRRPTCKHFELVCVQCQEP